jgi:hypothetical protein
MDIFLVTYGFQGLVNSWGGYRAELLKRQSMALASV